MSLRTPGRHATAHLLLVGRVRLAEFFKERQPVENAVLKIDLLSRLDSRAMEAILSRLGAKGGLTVASLDLVLTS